MISFLKNHPFAVEAFFENSIVLTFAFPKEELQPLIPECLRLDVFDNKWAFVAIAVVKTHALRIKGLPEFLGNDFMLVGYRIFVRYNNNAGKRLRGLFILRSETDKRGMAIMGNTFTHYNYIKTDINQVEINNQIAINADASQMNIVVERSMGDIELPKASPFADWKTARRFAGPLPFTFTYIKGENKILIIEGVRENWVPEPLRVINYNIPFLSSIGLSNGRLANAFIISDIPYYWEKGKIEKWNS